MVFGRAKVQKTAIALLGSLLLAASGVLPLNAAKRLEVQLDGMVIPVLIEELLDWGSAGGTSRSELTTWLNLLDAESQLDLLELLQAPLLTQQSMARQMLRSWAGRQLLDEFSDLLRVGDDSSGIVVLNTLESLLNNQAEVSTLDLLKALPAESIRLDLDALLRVASRWRSQLQQQQQLAKTLGRLSATPVPAPKELTHEIGRAHV